jgi:hypothetical protein
MTYSPSPEKPAASQGVRLTASWNRCVGERRPVRGSHRRTLRARSVEEVMRYLHGVAHQSRSVRNGVRHGGGP